MTGARPSPSKPRVVAVGLGPGDPGLVTVATRSALERIPHRFLRTSRHPSASEARWQATFDSLYESAVSLGAVYRGIVDALVKAASEHGEVLYAVPGSPLVAERSVELLQSDPRVQVEVLPALSFLDLVWARVGVDPMVSGARLVDGHRFALSAAGERGPLLVAQCDSAEVLSEIKLAFGEHPPDQITVLQRLGLPDEAVFTVPAVDLDRSFQPDHLTSLWIPNLAAPIACELVRFVELVATLRQRCPWDREQTHGSLTRHLLEETYEVLEAIEALGPAATADEAGTTTHRRAAAYGHLEEELGDLLFQVVFHATLAAEAGEFSLADVARGIHDKLVRRHPHVFGSTQADTSDAVVSNWEQIKKREKGRQSLMDGIPGNLPSLLYAYKVQRKAASVGFDWPSSDGAYDKVFEELAELRAEPSDEELGDVLFAVVNVARHLGLDPEAALRSASAKFRQRFGALERLAEERGIDVIGANLSVLDELWDEVKGPNSVPTASAHRHSK